MLACVRGLQSKVKKAHLSTLILLAIGTANTTWNLGTLSLIIYLVIVLVFVLPSRRVLYRKRLGYPIEKFVIDSLIFAGAYTLYVVIGTINAP